MLASIIVAALMYKAMDVYIAQVAARKEIQEEPTSDEGLIKLCQQPPYAQELLFCRKLNSKLPKEKVHFAFHDHSVEDDVDDETEYAPPGTSLVKFKPK